MFVTFNVVTFSDDVRITLYFGTSKLRTEIMLQVRFVFARHCNLFFITSQLCFYLFGVVTFFDDVIITLYFGTLELRTEITFKKGHFLVTFVCNQKMTKKYVIITSFFSWVTRSRSTDDPSLMAYC